MDTNIMPSIEELTQICYQVSPAFGFVTSTWQQGDVTKTNMDYFSNTVN
jgi:hypothetical protein